MNARRSERGFTLVETMVSVGILAIGVLAAVRLFEVTTHGSNWTRSRSAAAEIALQRIEDLGTQPSTALPNCVGTIGCRLDATTLATPLGAAGTYQCTQGTDEMELESETSAGLVGRYRIDTVVTAHPDADRQENARLVTVSVCWSDETGTVHQAQARRLMVPDADG